MLTSVAGKLALERMLRSDSLQLLCLEAVLLSGTIVAVNGLWKKNTSRHANRIKATEDRLRRSESHLKTLLESAPIALLALDGKGVCTLLEGRILHKLGFNARDTVGQSIFEVRRSETALLADVRRALRGECFRSLQTVNNIVIDIHYSPIIDDRGRCTGTIGVLYDMTDQHKAEMDCDFSQRRFRTLFEQSPVPFMRFSRDGTLIEANHAWEELFNIEISSLDGYNLLHDPQIKMRGMLPYVQHAFAGEVVHIPPLLYDPSLLNHPGRPRWVEVDLYPVKSGAGEIQEIGLIEQDVTDQMQALHALQKSEEHFRFLADAAPMMVWTAGADKTRDYLNKTWLEFTGFELEQGLGSGWTQAVHPEDYANCLRTYYACFEQRQPFEVEYRLRRADGTYRWVLDRGCPKYDQELFIGFIGSCVDITERKRAETVLALNEQRFRLLADAGTALGSSLDDTEILSKFTSLVTPRFADWCFVNIIDENGQVKPLSVAHIDPARAEKAQHLLKVALASPVAQGSARVARTGKSEFHAHVSPKILKAAARSLKHLRFLKTLRMNSWICIPLRARGRVFGTVCFITTRESGRRYGTEDLHLAEDLVERAALAVENARLYQESQAINRIKDEFLATLSHELRTPLNVIQGHAELLKFDREHLTAEDMMESIDAIHRNAVKQTRIVGDLLDVSAIIKGRMPFQPVAVDPAEQAREIVKNLGSTLEAKHIELRCDFAGAPARVHADPTRLQQMVWNLLSNAIKFTPVCGQIKLEIKVRQRACAISVADNGCGIDPEFLPFIFKRFCQEDSSLTRRYGGLGLGLSIVRHLAELHGGHVEAHSAGPGQGATFTIILPLK